jgi:serine/threonine protein phosphatase PrpC
MAEQKMYFAARHLGVKLDQDRHWCAKGSGTPLLALCDGIGEYPGSGAVAELMIDMVSERMPRSHKEWNECVVAARDMVLEKRLEGGTTLLSCYAEEEALDASDRLIIHHLGNGAVLHLAGDFHDLGPSQAPYKVNHVVMPHVNGQGALARHVSHGSGAEELRLSEQVLRLNQPAGDIVLMVTDGITTLEEEMLIKHMEAGYLRVQSEALQYVLGRLHSLLQVNCVSLAFGEVLEQFTGEVLLGLKEEQLLDDDAALGLVVTQRVLDHYAKMVS